jgi:helicase
MKKILLISSIVATGLIFAHLYRKKHPKILTPEDYVSFLKNIGTLVVDESHLLTVPGRGDHLEVGLMKFTEINKDARVILLSATMPNVEEIAGWVSYGLTKKDTFVLESKYRPVPLNIHYEVYDDKGIRSYSFLEQEKINLALDIVEYYSQDKFLIFSHTKKTGELMKKELLKIGIAAEFHNADLDKKTRISLENRFKNEKEPRVIVATSSLGWGVNLPARRVIILGVHRGSEEVESYDVLQMVGRSGRLGIDPAGDAYILIPETEQLKYKQKFSKSSRIESQLLEKSGSHYKNLAFHLVSEIYNESVQTTDDVQRWFERSLAYFQNKQLQDKVIDDVLDSLKKYGAIGCENDRWYTKTIGKVSSIFYYSPFDVSDLFFNIKFLFDNKKQNDEYYVSMALANLDSNRMPIVSKLEKDEMSSYKFKVLSNKNRGFITEGSVKFGFTYFNLMKGKVNPVFASLQRNLQLDFNRLSQVIQMLDSLGGKWNAKSWIKDIEAMVVYGVPKHLVDLCSVPNVGRARANKLYEAGIKDKQTFINCDKEKLRKILNLKPNIIEKMINDAS